ncbi:uncharacterized protein LOC142412860 isoform X3 [Mycteria americana]|uniref:uncharacterized protein LOC142412860 isoform X3 n=1 Tax=Mycteria americana TaxID=33587 RepID=UPI003F586598
MEAAGGGQVGFSPSWRRDELRRLRRLRRRWSSDPLLARLRSEAGSPTARRSVGPVLKRKRLPGTAPTDRRRKVWENPPKLPQLEPCPDDWLYYKKKCYYHSRAMADWNSSQEFCSAYGASLAVVDSHQELDFIMYRIRITDFWIGLRRKGNKFFWVNGELFNKNFHILCIPQRLSKIGGRGGRAPLCTGGVLLPWVPLGSSLSCSGQLFHINITNDGDCVHIDSTFISTRACSSLRNGLCTIGQFNPKTSS